MFVYIHCFAFADVFKIVILFCTIARDVFGGEWFLEFRTLMILNMSIKQYLQFRNISRLLCAGQKGRIQECHKRRL